jgi:hypothetical protein
MGPDSVMKDHSIVSVVERLRTSLAPRVLVVQDHWEADLYATGVAGVGDPTRLVYISTFNKAGGRYDYECEQGAAGGASTMGKDVKFGRLCEIVRRHVG